MTKHAQAEEVDVRRDPHPDFFINAYNLFDNEPFHTRNIYAVNNRSTELHAWPRDHRPVSLLETR